MAGRVLLRVIEVSARVVQVGRGQRVKRVKEGKKAAARGHKKPSKGPRKPKELNPFLTCSNTTEVSRAPIAGRERVVNTGAVKDSRTEHIH